MPEELGFLRHFYIQMNIILYFIPIILGIGLIVRKRMKEVSFFLIAYGILSGISGYFKYLLINQPKPFVGENLILFLAANSLFLAIPCCLLFAFLKSYKLNQYYYIPVLAWQTIMTVIIVAYPHYLFGASLIALMRTFYFSIFVLILIIGLVLFFYRKANLNQTLLLFIAAEGILQYLIAIFSPAWVYSWTVLSCYYVLLLILLVLPNKYIDLIDSLTVDSSPQ